MSRPSVNFKHTPPCSKRSMIALRGTAAAGLALGMVLLSAPSAFSQAPAPRSITDFLRPCGPLKGTAYNDCVDKARKDYAASLQKSTPLASGQTAPGVCSLDNARLQFYADTKSLQPFEEVQKQFRYAIDGLNSKVGDEGHIPAAPFGPQSSPTAQEKNRSGALDFLRRSEQAFSSNVDLYATLSHPDCFKCAIIEKWAVLTGAVNLVVRTWRFKEFGLRIGSGISTNMDWTESDAPTAGSPKANNFTRNIAKIVRNSGRKPIDMNQVTDQWVGGLDPTFVDNLKRAMCDMVNTPNSNAYNDNEKYSFYAMKVQEVVNEGFIFWNNVFQPAEDAEAEATRNNVKPQRVRELLASTGNAQCNPTNSRQFELAAYDFPSFFNPMWCARYRAPELSQQK